MTNTAGAKGAAARSTALATATTVGPTAEPLAEALERLARGTPTDLAALLYDVERHAVVGGTNVTAHCHCLRLDGNGRPRIEALVAAVAEHVLQGLHPLTGRPAPRSRREQHGQGDRGPRRRGRCPRLVGRCPGPRQKPGDAAGLKVGSGGRIGLSAEVPETLVGFVHHVVRERTHAGLSSDSPSSAARSWCGEERRHRRLVDRGHDERAVEHAVHPLAGDLCQVETAVARSALQVSLLGA
jgi:hypothetical protein